MWIALQVTSLLAVFPHASLFGRVRSSQDSTPVQAVVIELSGGPNVMSDADGRYAFRELEPGHYRLQLSRVGYASRALTVVLVPGDSLQVDVALEPVPRALAPLHVIAIKPTNSPVDTTAAFPELGIRTSSPAQWRTEGSWLAQPDAFATFEGAPGVSFDVERSAALHVHGGESDQNLLLLDGAPVYAAYHFGNTVGVLNPDALSGVALHAGVPSASWGDALTSVVSAQTLVPDRSRLNVRGALGPMDARLTIDGPMTARTGVLVSARRDFPALWTPRGDESRVDGANDDLLAKVTADAPRGTVELLFLVSTNVLRFPTTADGGGTPTDSLGGSDRNSLPANLTDVTARHRFAWRGTTSSMRWATAPGAHGDASVQVWRTDLRTDADWRAPPLPVELASSRRGSGIKARLSRNLGRAAVLGGVDAEHSHVAYGIEGDTGLAAPLVSMDTSFERMSAFVEHRFRGERVETSLGLRGTLGTGHTNEIEPRVGVRYRVGGSMAIGVGFARMFQSIQSLRNPASLASALFSADLPVAVARGQDARADQIVVEVSGEPSARSRLTLEGYWRWLKRLVLVEPVTALPFADGRYDLGTGEAAGASLAFERRDARTTFAATYALGLSARSLVAYEYHVGFQPEHTLITSLAYKASPSTLFRISAHAHSNTPTSVVGGRFDWEACDPLDAGCEAAGTPQRNVGPLDGIRVPGYLRVDISARHGWMLHLSPRPLEVATFASVGNVFGRHNLWAYTSSSGVLQRVGLAARPPSLLSAGVEWSW